MYVQPCLSYPRYGGNEAREAGTPQREIRLRRLPAQTL